MAVRTKSRKGKALKPVKKTRPAKSAKAKVAAARKKKAAPKRAPKSEPEITLKTIIKEAAALRARKHELLTHFASKAGAAHDPMARAHMKVVLHRYETLIGPHSPGEGEEDAALPSFTMKIGGPRGGGEPEDA